MSELGAVADVLEEMGYPGHAGAVRVLEYMLGLEDFIDFERVLLRALRVVEGSGRPELADGLLRALGGWEETRRSRPVRVEDEDGVLERNPGVARGVVAWARDPGRKLPGLVISVREWIAGEEPVRFDIRMAWEGDGRRYRVGRVLETELLTQRPGPGLAAHVFRVLEAMYEELIRGEHVPAEFITGLTAAGPVARTAPDPLG